MTKMMPWQKMRTMTKMSKQTVRRAARAVCLGTALLWVAGTTATGTAHAYQRGTVLRTIEGKVHDSADTPLQGAVVYLKDSRTLAVKSFLSDEEGTFHFGQLSQNTDYEIYAEFGGKRSKSKSISSFDNKNSFSFVLKIDAKK